MTILRYLMRQTMKNILTAVLMIVVFLTAFRAAQADEKTTDPNKVTVAAYYFPNYHTGDPRISKMEGKGPKWSEWELVKQARPRFEGHQQPKVPLWGYTDEKDPVAMEVKIKAAADHGIDVFLFDWYMYEDGPFLDRCLDEGFLKAKNVNDIKFALMWANHDWVEIHPYKRGTPQKLVFPEKVSAIRFEEIGDLLIEKYFSKQNYWKINGKAYFSVYDVQKFVEGFGSLEATRLAMKKLDEKARKAGVGGVHWNLVAWGNPILPVENAPPDVQGLVKSLGFDSTTSYVWIHHCILDETATDYNYVRDRYFEHWDRAKETYGVPYFPNVTMGWDSSPRTDRNSEWGDFGYPYMNTIGNNTPENFKKAIEMTKRKLLDDPNGPRILNINCWNEWTEGSYLEPDKQNGMKYLEAVRDAIRDSH